VEEQKVKSPCNNTCKYDEFDLCIGCYRTKQEIVAWITMNNAEKELVLQKVEARKKPGMKYKIE